MSQELINLFFLFYVPLLFGSRVLFHVGVRNLGHSLFLALPQNTSLIVLHVLFCRPLISVVYALNFILSVPV